MPGTRMLDPGPFLSFDHFKKGLHIGARTMPSARVLDPGLFLSFDLPPKTGLHIGARTVPTARVLDPVFFPLNSLSVRVLYNF